MGIYKSVNRLFEIGLNTPEIIIALYTPKDKDQYDRYKVLLNQICITIRKKSGLFRLATKKGDLLDFITGKKVSERIMKLIGEIKNFEEFPEIIIFKGPKNPADEVGSLTISPNYMGVTSSETPYTRIVWRDIVKSSIHQEILNELAPFKNRLDGMDIIFSYHPVGGEGVVQRKILYWGE